MMKLRHPGKELSDLMKDRGVTETVISKTCGLSKSLVTLIIRGDRRITPQTALALEVVFNDVPAEKWCTLQTEYDLYELRHGG